MIRVSYSLQKSGFGAYYPLQASFEELKKLVTESPWSPICFRNSVRKQENFEESSLLVLDYDEGLSLEDAIKKFQGFKHIIGTTRNHQKVKHEGSPSEKPACDRFRVILFFEDRIQDLETYKESLRVSVSSLGADEACKDGARLFYPCTQIVSEREEGELVKISTPKQKVETRTPPRSLSDDQKGKLARSTLEFLVKPPTSGWNAACFKAAKDWQEQGYSREEFEERILNLDGFLDEPSRRTIESAFSKEPKYEPRLEKTEEVSSLILRSDQMKEDLFSYIEKKDLVRGQSTYLEGLDKLLAGKRLGEVTATCAEGKTGKNALWHFLQWLWLKQGVKFAYASRELDPVTEVLPDYLSMELEKNFRLTELTETVKREASNLLDSWRIPFAPGYGWFALDQLRAWVEECVKQDVRYFFFDHLHYCLEDPEDYKAASLLSRELKTMAKQINIHVDVIIQPKVLMDGQRPSLNSMKGGSAIGQNIDNLLTLERVPGEKFISKLSLKAKRSRLAETGEIFLRYNSETLTFTEVDPVPEGESQANKLAGTINGNQVTREFPSPVSLDRARF